MLNTTDIKVKNSPGLVSEFNKPYVVAISFVAALGGLLFGFDTAIISGTITFIKPFFGLNEFLLGWSVSSILLGCAIGAAFAGKLSDMLGRKKILLIAAFLFAVTGIGSGIANSLSIFIFFRILGGLAVGMTAMVSPMYIAESVPAAFRGRMVSLYQLAIVSGILLAYLSNYLLADYGENGWRWMFASQAIPSLVFFVALFFVPESIRWLIKKNKKQEAARILEKIGGATYSNSVLKLIENSFENKPNEKLTDLMLPAFRNVLWIGITVAIFQQITGINAILYYAPQIFKQTGVTNQNALLQTIGIGLMMFLFTLLAICWIDKIGRKILLLIGSAVMGFSLVGVAMCFSYKYFDYYFVLIFLMLYIAGFSASLGAVTWVLLSEIFPNQIRGIALSVTTLILWIADFIASLTFPVLNEKLGVGSTLLIFAALCGFYFVYIRLKIPETKGKSLEELERLLLTKP